MKKNILLLMGSLFVVGSSLHAQCIITNLDTVQCSNGSIVTMATMGNG